MEVNMISWDGSAAGIDTASLNFSPDLVLYFGDSDVLQKGRDHLLSLAPDAVLLGCSTGGQIFDNIVDEPEFVGAAIKFSSTRVKSAKSPVGVDVDSAAAGKFIGEQLAADDLAGIIVLSDGLSANGSDLADGISRAIGAGVPVVGGLAGDGARFEQTLVGLNGDIAPGQVAAIGLYGPDLNIGHGSEGGWRTFGPRRKMTRSEGNVLYELDGQPALDLYEKYLGDEAAGLPSSALLFPLEVSDPDVLGSGVVRTILNIDREKRSLIFAGNMEQGFIAQLMKASHDSLLNGAAEAAAAAKQAVIQEPDGELALMVSCIGRRLVMKQRAEEEVDAAGDELGSDMPRIGFYSYGEICPKATGGRPLLHNQTMTISVISERGSATRA